MIHNIFKIKQKMNRSVKQRRLGSIKFSTALEVSYTLSDKKQGIQTDFGDSLSGIAIMMMTIRNRQNGSFANIQFKNIYKRFVK